MDLRELRCFAACVECGSINKAAEKLYTTQPSVTRLVHSLENELGKELFVRSSKGLALTAFGTEVYSSALNMLRLEEAMKESAKQEHETTLRISAYPSNTISRLMAAYMKQHPELRLEYRSVGVMDILANVEHGLSELGIVYIARRKFSVFQTFLEQKHLSFTELGCFPPRIYVGPHSPFYEAAAITPEDLKKLKYMRELGDFFSIQNDHEDFAGIFDDRFPTDFRIYTNSEHLSRELYNMTDFATIGIQLDPLPSGADLYDEFCDHRPVQIEGADSDSDLLLGYVCDRRRSMSGATMTGRLMPGQAMSGQAMSGQTMPEQAMTGQGQAFSEEAAGFLKLLEELVAYNAAKQR